VPSSLSPEVEDFITKYIESLEELEVLLLLSNSPDKSWSPKAVDEEIKSSLTSVEQRLQRLASNGLLNVTNNPELAYQYQPATPATAEAVKAVASAYKERRLKVIEFLFSKPISPLQRFSDAFKIRKDPKNG
jgi:hypothetical protein